MSTLHARLTSLLRPFALPLLATAAAGCSAMGDGTALEIRLSRPTVASPSMDSAPPPEWPEWEDPGLPEAGGVWFEDPSDTIPFDEEPAVAWDGSSYPEVAAEDPALVPVAGEAELLPEFDVAYDGGAGAAPAPAPVARTGAHGKTVVKNVTKTIHSDDDVSNVKHVTRIKNVTNVKNVKVIERGGQNAAAGTVPHHHGAPVVVAVEDAKQNLKPEKGAGKKDGKPEKGDGKKDGKAGKGDGKKDGKPEKGNGKKDGKAEKGDGKKDGKFAKGGEK